MNHVSTRALVANFLATVGGFTNITRRQPLNLRFVMPLLVVERFGGSDRLVTVDVARIDIDTFCATEDAADVQAENVRTLLRTRLPGRVWGGATVLRVETFSAPRPLPWDSRNEVFRVGGSYQITTRTFAGVW